MSIVETILAMLGTRKLTTSKDYKKIEQKLDLMNARNDALVRIFIKKNWDDLSISEKKLFLPFLKQEKENQERTESQEIISGIFSTIKTVLLLIGAFFFVFWLIVLIIGLA